MDMLNRDFAHNPTNISIARSRFDRNSKLLTTFDEGQLIPIYCDEILPGDTFAMDMSFLCRMTTPIYPVMDNADLDVFWFFVPNRLLMDHWQELCGENKSLPWAQETVYQVPQLKFDQLTGTVAFEYGAGNGLMNYLGVPSILTSSKLTVSDLPNRAYRLIWNEFFRDENLQSPVAVYTDDTDRSHVYGGYGSEILTVAKYHDYFTSCLPQPQKGDPAAIALVGSAPVKVGADHTSYMPGSTYSSMPVHFWSASQLVDNTELLAAFNKESSQIASMKGVVSTVTHTTGQNVLQPNNLWADLSESSVVSISALREAFAVQKWLEASARSGTRYREILLGMFGVTSPDASMQVPEYLGGTRVPINIDQVVQTSATDQVTPQGNTAAYSMTSYRGSSFTKSFTEFGILLGLACVRVEHSYAQGVAKFLRRKSRLDFYWPQFAHISEQPVYQSEVFCDGSSQSLSTVFGYNEAWADYRYKPSVLSGLFKPQSHSVDDDGNIIQVMSPLASAWTYADHYELYPPTLGSEWIQEGSSHVANTLAVQDEPQFLLNCYFRLNCTRPLPLYSIPGLIDHY